MSTQVLSPPLPHPPPSTPFGRVSCVRMRVCIDGPQSQQRSWSGTPVRVRVAPTPHSFPSSFPAPVP